MFLFFSFFSFLFFFLASTRNSTASIQQLNVGIAHGLQKSDWISWMLDCQPHESRRTSRGVRAEKTALNDTRE